MKKTNLISHILIMAGISFLVGALFLAFKNQYEALRAREMSYEVLDQMLVYYESNQNAFETNDDSQIPEVTKDGYSSTRSNYPEIYSQQMPVVALDGNDYIGYLTIPELNLILPIMSEWDYEKLQIAPCRYKGEVKSDDLIVCAHNYPTHFQKIGELSSGSQITVTDMTGFVTTYQVIEVEILSSYDIEDMESSGYSLTLFTCTYGGQNRITVRCDRVI